VTRLQLLTNVVNAEESRRQPDTRTLLAYFALLQRNPDFRELVAGNILLAEGSPFGTLLAVLIGSEEFQRTLTGE